MLYPPCCEKPKQPGSTPRKAKVPGQHPAPASQVAADGPLVPSGATLADAMRSREELVPLSPGQITDL